jgi:hypothetical protein
MSALTPQRVFLFLVALLLPVTAYANFPSARSYPRMAFDEDAGQGVLFGGESAIDNATGGIAYDSDETWIWTGSRWRQAFPSTKPAKRSAHGMAYDSIRKRIVMFGGRQARTDPEGSITLLGDTWIYDNDNWVALNPPNSPQPRHLFAMGYDPRRDRVMLFGGVARKGDTDFEIVYDTWEFDGTTWTQVPAQEGLKVNAPMLTFDKQRGQMMLLGTDDSRASIMFFFDGNSRTWVQHKPEKMPDCINDGAMVARNNGSIIAFGGVCTINTPSTDETWEWSGVNWFKLDVTSFSRATGMASAYDTLHHTIISFGGFEAFTTSPRSFTTLFHDNWELARQVTRPTPRSLMAVETDPHTNTVWVYGGLNEFGTGYIDDFWGYRNRQWFAANYSGEPSECGPPNLSYDIDRKKLVLICSGSSVFELEGTEWKDLTPKSGLPTVRRLAGVVYDENIKKTVMFGGFDGSGNYRRDTWTWDGTKWTEIKNDRPPARSSMAMWYDPLAKRTIIYSGLGRNNIDERITRYTDMWSFNGSGWTKMNVTATPGERFGAAVSVDPTTGKAVLFGGLRSEVIDTQNNARRQYFGEDTWIWDGAASTWTQIAPTSRPGARQNASMAWDPIAKELVMFGGYAAFYFSDVWAFSFLPNSNTTGTWRGRGDAGGRQRAAGPIRIPQSPSVEHPSID